MASFHEFLKKIPDGSPIKGMKGIESGWLELEEFGLAGKRFLVSDAGYLGMKEDGVSLAAEPGNYLVELKVMNFGKDQRISRLRARLAGVESTEAKEAGEAWIDGGIIGFADGDALSELGDELDSEDRAEEFDEALWGNKEMFGTFRFGENGPTMIYVDSGFGDGKYRVCQLVREGVGVGFEVELIAAEATYPFDKAIAC